MRHRATVFRSERVSRDTRIRRAMSRNAPMFRNAEFVPQCSASLKLLRFASIRGTLSKNGTLWHASRPGTHSKVGTRWDAMGHNAAIPLRNTNLFRNVSLCYASTCDASRKMRRYATLYVATGHGIWCASLRDSRNCPTLSRYVPPGAPQHGAAQWDGTASNIKKHRPPLYGLVVGGRSGAGQLAIVCSLYHRSYPPLVPPRWPHSQDNIRLLVIQWAICPACSR